MPGSRSSGVLALAVTLLACAMPPPPPPALPSQLGSCSPGNYGVRSADRCEVDADCVACGPRCRGARVDRCEAPCEEVEAACCEGRCVELLGSPPL